MKYIELSKGMQAIVDDDWHAVLSKFKWYACCSEWGCYACREVGTREAHKRIFMHRYITMAPDEYEVDHINGNKLDNRAENLRLVTPSPNRTNRGPQVNNKTGYKGVSLDKRDGRYLATIQWKKKQYHIGRFATKEEAARAYNARAIELHGEYAKLNVIPGE